MHCCTVCVYFLTHIHITVQCTVQSTSTGHVMYIVQVTNLICFDFTIDFAHFPTVSSDGEGKGGED